MIERGRELRRQMEISAAKAVRKKGVAFVKRAGSQLGFAGVGKGFGTLVIEKESLGRPQTGLMRIRQSQQPLAAEILPGSALEDGSADGEMSPGAARSAMPAQDHGQIGVEHQCRLSQPVLGSGESPDGPRLLDPGADLNLGGEGTKLQLRAPLRREIVAHKI